MITDSGKYYLYRHVRPDKNEVFYVGIGAKAKHFSKDTEYFRAYSDYGRNHIWKGIVKRNSNYEVEILFESDDRNFIKEREIEFISLYGRIDLKTGSLANLHKGGIGGLDHHSLEWRENRSKAMKGKIWSKEVIERRAKTMRETGVLKEKARLNAAKRKRKIIQMDLKGNFIKEWDCIIDAADFYKIHNSRIVSACKRLDKLLSGDNKKLRKATCEGYIWKYKNKEDELGQF